jgi:hypothetical protein
MCDGSVQVRSRNGGARGIRTRVAVWRCDGRTTRLRMVVIQQDPLHPGNGALGPTDSQGVAWGVRWDLITGGGGKVGQA